MQRYDNVEVEGRRRWKETDGESLAASVTLHAADHPVGTVLEVRAVVPMRPVPKVLATKAGGSLERWIAEEVGSRNRWRSNKGHSMPTMPLHAADYPEGTEITIRRGGCPRDVVDEMTSLINELLLALERGGQHQTARAGAMHLARIQELAPR